MLLLLLFLLQLVYFGCNNSISILEQVKSNIIYRWFVFVWTGLVKFTVEFSEPEQKWRKDAEGNLSAESSGPEHEWRKDAEENLSAFVNNAAEAWNRLSHSQVEKSVQAYKQSLTRTARIHHRDLVYKEIKTTLNQCNIPEQKVSVFAETLTEITLTDSTLLHADPADCINVRCRCRTVEALYGLRQLIDSGKMANHFSLIMRCLIRQRIMRLK